MEEIYKDIIGYEEYYQVSNMGNVRRMKAYRGTYVGRILKPRLASCGYQIVKLSTPTKGQDYKLARLVALHFIPNPENKREVNHIDGNKLNNHASNLEWNTRSENQKHAFRTGLQKIKRGAEVTGAKLCEEQVMKIRALAPYMSRRDIAEIYHLNQAHVCNIVNRKAWVHI